MSSRADVPLVFVAVTSAIAGCHKAPPPVVTHSLGDATQGCSWRATGWRCNGDDESLGSGVGRIGTTLCANRCQAGVSRLAHCCDTDTQSQVSVQVSIGGRSHARVKKNHPSRQAPFLRELRHFNGIGHLRGALREREGTHSSGVQGTCNRLDVLQMSFAVRGSDRK
jgi:hypothetical protein